MSAAGRKSKYEEIKNKIDLIREWKRLGATDEQICEQLNIGKTSFYEYQRKYPQFANAIKVGVQEFVLDLKGELAYLAKKHTLETKKNYIKIDQETGHKTQYTEITTKEVDGNISAIHLLLKNLDRENWKNDWDNFDFKQQELELKKQMLEENKW